MRLYTILSMLLISLQPSWGQTDFFCQCQATGPGFEQTNEKTGGIDKICSYQCSCLTWEPSSVPKMKVPVQLEKLPTTALSRESWDHGSHICHGQYSYKPQLSDANWKIQVRFDVFSINSNGDVIYPEGARRQIAQGINYEGFKYTKSAPEISSALKLKLQKTNTSKDKY